MHLHNLRTVGYCEGICELLIYWWGDPEALRYAQYLTDVVFDESRMAKGYGSTATPRMVMYKGEKVSDEQPGLRRFNYQATSETVASVGRPDYIDTDTRSNLHFDLQTATVSGLKYMMKENLEHGTRAQLELVSAYCDDMKERLRFSSAIEAPDAPWYVHGKSLTHAAKFRWLHHWYEWLCEDDKQELVACKFYADALAADVEIVMIDGFPVAVQPHFTKGLQSSRSQDTGHGQEFQDITYPREENRVELMGFFLGAPGVDEAHLEASANNLHMVCLYDGADGEGVSKTVGGHGSKDFNGKAGVIYKGNLYPSRYKNFRADGHEGMHQISHGLHTCWSAWGSQTEKYKRDLELLNKRPDSIEFQRYGAYVGLMFFERDSRIEG